MNDGQINRMITALEKIGNNLERIKDSLNDWDYRKGDSSINIDKNY